MTGSRGRTPRTSIWAREHLCVISGEFSEVWDADGTEPDPLLLVAKEVRELLKQSNAIPSRTRRGGGVLLGGLGGGESPPIEQSCEGGSSAAAAASSSASGGEAGTAST